jgi:hypothetical protein
MAEQQHGMQEQAAAGKSHGGLGGGYTVRGRVRTGSTLRVAPLEPGSRPSGQWGPQPSATNVLCAWLGLLCPRLEDGPGHPRPKGSRELSFQDTWLLGCVTLVQFLALSGPWEAMFELETILSPSWCEPGTRGAGSVLAKVSPGFVGRSEGGLLVRGAILAGPVAFTGVETAGEGGSSEPDPR